MANLPSTAAFIGISLDGFIAREDDDLSWLFTHGTTEGSGYEALMADIDTLVMGRGTFDVVTTFDQWPYKGKRVVVLSTSSPEIPEHLLPYVEVMSLDPVALLKHLGESGTKRVYVDGGLTIQGFLRAGVLDEIILTRVPVLIGTGKPLFGDIGRDVVLQHVETRTLTGGSVQSHYRINTRS